MSNVYIVSDHHLHHENIWKTFKRSDGTPLRPFTSTEEMDETLIQRHNEVVKPGDKVYFLGDVIINKKYLFLVRRMNGRKTLIAGNHDIFNSGVYLKAGFDNIRGVRVLSDMILSHIPLNCQNITNRFHVNVHGHLHCNYINNPTYLCVCVEHTDYRPLSIDEVRQRIKAKEDFYRDIAPTGKIVLGVVNTKDGVYA